MARKTLLNESEIRKFLKLANITTVGNRKIQEMGGMPGGGAYDREEEEDEDPMGGAPAELEVGADEESLGEPVDLEDEEEEVPPMMEDEKNEELSEDDIVSEVARRVAKRLQDDSNKEAMVDNLAERILKRLTK